MPIRSTSVPSGSHGMDEAKGSAPRCSAPTAAAKTTKPNTQERAIPPTATAVLTRGLRLAHRTIRPKASSGGSGMRPIRSVVGMGLRSPLHQVDVFGDDRRALTVDRDDQRQPDGGLRGGHGEDDDGESLTGA